MKLLNERISRRTAMRGILAAGVAPMFAPARLFGADAPSNKITIGCIGIGTHGFGVNLKSFLNEDAARVVVCCDVFRDRAAKGKAEVDAKYGTKDCAVTQDYREVLARKDVDAVMISTPDHWHVPMSLKALRAGKDVICEKPTLTIAQGRELADEVKKLGRVFQVALEDRSLSHYHRFAELVRNGAIGKLKHMDVKLPAGSAYPKEAEEKPPESLDWPMWLGPAPEAPFSKTRTEPQVWRQIRDYSGGKFTDWGAHLLDTAQVANFAEDSGPVEVEGRGEKAVDSMSTTFIRYDINYRYANGVTMNVKSGGVAIRFTGEKGWIGNNSWQGGFEASDKKLLTPKFEAATNKIWPRPPREHRNFLDCVKSRAPTTYTAEAGHRLSTVMHIANISMELGRKLQWDPAAESFNDDAANALRSRESRPV